MVCEVFRLTSGKHSMVGKSGYRVRAMGGVVAGEMELDVVYMSVNSSSSTSVVAS